MGGCKSSNCGSEPPGDQKQVELHTTNERINDGMVIVAEVDGGTVSMDTEAPAVATMWYVKEKPVDAQHLRAHWGLKEQPFVSEPMETTFQAEGPVGDYFAEIRKQIGIPGDNDPYKFVFVHPSEDSPDGFIGGFVYYSGEWRGLTDATKIVGANHLAFGVLQAFDEDGDHRFLCHLHHINVSEKAFSAMELNIAMHPCPHLKGFPVSHWQWISPAKARVMALNTEGAIHASQDGAFIFTRSDRGGHMMYALTHRLLLRDPPHQATCRMPPEMVSLLADEYIRDKRSTPASEPLRMLLLLGGSGAGKSTLVKFLGKHGVDMDRDWVLSGLDEFLGMVPEYRHAISDYTVGYMTAADSSYTDAIAIAKKVNLFCNDRRLNLIIEDTGKSFERSCRYIDQAIADGRIVTVALVDNDPEVAIARALGRFQMTGRFSSALYIRDSFMGVFGNYCELKAMTMKKALNVNSYIYVDNGPERETRHWLDFCSDEAKSIIPRSRFCQDDVVYRPHLEMLFRLYHEESDKAVFNAYQEFVKHAKPSDGGLAVKCVD